MSLEGLSVKDWLAQQRPAPVIAPVAVTAGGGSNRRASRAFSLLASASGAAVGAWFAGGLGASGSCPPAREGLVYCQLQHGVLRALMAVLLGALAGLLLARGLRALVSAPGRARAGTLLAPAPPPMRLDDPLLVLASGGLAYRDSRRLGPVWRPRWEQLAEPRGAG